MKYYDEETAEKFYLCAYARMRLDPGGLLLTHTLSGEEWLLPCGRKTVSHLWRLLTDGSSYDLLCKSLSETGESGEKLFAILVGKGMIE